LSSGGYIGLIRDKVAYMISMLKAKGDVGWYCFWIHDRDSRVPTSEDNDYLYFHIRFKLKRHISLVDILPIFCVLVRQVESEWVKSIAINSNGAEFEASLLRDESVEKV
jgi:hypothetical protein